MNTPLNPTQKSLAKKFIQKFEAIPKEKWCTYIRHDDYGRSCALGFTHPRSDCRGTEETVQLASLFHNNQIHIWGGEQTIIWGGEQGVADINNGKDPRYQQKEPKDRILAALRDLIV